MLACRKSRYSPSNPIRPFIQPLKKTHLHVSKDEFDKRTKQEQIDLMHEPDPARRHMICEAVIDMSAAYFNVSSRQLRRPGRCVQAISRVRQVAMYVAHTGLGFTMTDVGKGFCRDRTTVMHACHQIEDLRDDEEFDAIVDQFNRIVTAAFQSEPRLGDRGQ